VLNLSQQQISAYTEPEPDDCEGKAKLRVVVVLDHPEDPHYPFLDFFATQEVRGTRCGPEPTLSGVEGERWRTGVGLWLDRRT
jgi:hypothetical protein